MDTNEKNVGSLGEVMEFKGERYVTAGDNRIHVFSGRGWPSLMFEIAKLIHDCSPVVEEKGEKYRSLKNLKKCIAPGCNNFFWQAHKKEKNYCSNKCAMRAYVKAKREAEKPKKDEKPKRRKEV